MENQEIISAIIKEVAQFSVVNNFEIVNNPTLEIRHTSFLIYCPLSNGKSLYIKILKYKDIDGKNLDQAIKDENARSLGEREYLSYDWFSKHMQTDDLKISTLPVLAYLKKWNAIVSYELPSQELFKSLQSTHLSKDLSSSSQDLYRIGQWMRRIHETIDTEWVFTHSLDAFCHNICEGYEHSLKALFTPQKLAYSFGLTDFDCRDILVRNDQLYCLDLCIARDKEPQLRTVGQFVAGLELLYWGRKDYTLKPVPYALIESFLGGYFRGYSEDYIEQKKIVMWFAVQAMLRHSWQVSGRKSVLRKIYHKLIAKPYQHQIYNRYFQTMLTYSGHTSNNSGIASENISMPSLRS